MSAQVRTLLTPLTPGAILLILLLHACSTPPLRIQSDIVPAQSLRVAQVTVVAKREEIVKAEAYKAILAAGVADSDLIDGSIVLARVFCCGGITPALSEERLHERMLFVPKDVKVISGDIVEVKVGRPPEKGDGGLLNTVTRVIQSYEENLRRYNEQTETCWWDPKDGRLWLRVLYCDWMPKDGWIKQTGASPAWYKPSANESP